jgi:hypothetical protein
MWSLIHKCPVCGKRKGGKGKHGKGINHDKCAEILKTDPQYARPKKKFVKKLRAANADWLGIVYSRDFE